MASAAPSSSSPVAQRGFAVSSAVLYQPDSTLRRRIADINAMAAYNSALEEACRSHFADASQPEALDVVVALRPGGRSRIWFLTNRSADDASLSSLRGKLEKVTPPVVKEGPVVFALLGALGGLQRDKPSQNFQPPMPAEWKAASARHGEPLTVPDGVLAEVWP